MATTLPNVLLPAFTWVNLYAATGIAVGTKIIVQNLTPADVRLCSKATSPLVTDGHNVISYTRNAVNQASDPGAWAMCSVDGAVNVAVSV